MKSLEIVNELIEWCHKCNTPAIAIGLDSLQQIKQDLEVLEILRVRVFGEDEYCVKGKCIVVEDNYRDLCHIFFKDDEREKVKQWLEENENELGD